MDTTANIRQITAGSQLGALIGEPVKVIISGSNLDLDFGPLGIWWGQPQSYEFIKRRDGGRQAVARFSLPGKGDVSVRLERSPTRDAFTLRDVTTTRAD